MIAIEDIRTGIVVEMSREFYERGGSPSDCDNNEWELGFVEMGARIVGKCQATDGQTWYFLTTPEDVSKNAVRIIRDGLDITG